MKKIKIFALTALLCAMGMNAFADASITVTSITATPRLTDGSSPLTFTGVTMTTSDDYKTVKSATASVKAAGAIGDATSIEIPATVDMYVEDTNYKGYVTFTVTSVEANAFKNNTNIEEVTFATGSKLVTIGASAFEGCTSLGGISIPATVTTISGSAFKGCNALGTFELANDSQLGDLAASSLEGTGLTSLDLSKALKYKPSTTVTGLTTVNAIFGTSGKTSLLSVNLPTTVTTIKANAFKGDTRLATVTNLDKVTTIEESAFEGTALSGILTLAGNITVDTKAFKDVTKITAVTFGNIDGSNDVATDAFTGCTGLLTVTYGDILHVDAAGSTPAKNGSIAKATFANNTTVTTLNFGAISSAATTVFPAKAFQGMTMLETINITGKVTIANVFANAIFGDGTTPVSTNLTTINYAVEGAETALFQIQAFANADATTPAIKLNAVEAIYNLYKPTTDETNLDEKLYNVYIEATAAVAAEGKIGALQTDGETKKMLKDKDGDFYYYWFQTGANIATIDKVQASGARVIAYSAYVDFSDYSICMNPLALLDGKYYVNANSIVIVKSTTEDAVEYNKTTKTWGSIQTFTGYTGATTCNELKLASKKYTYANILDDGTTFPKDADDECTVWAWANPVNYGFMFTNLTEQQKGMAKGAIYIAVAGTAPVAEAFARIKWLDEDGNVTAITGAKTETILNDGAIYNLAGQKVDANYKGIVIKNGKKMIQR